MFTQLPVRKSGRLNQMGTNGNNSALPGNVSKKRQNRLFV